jgi:hypothetical protein
MTFHLTGGTALSLAGTVVASGGTAFVANPIRQYPPAPSDGWHGEGHAAYAHVASGTRIEKRIVSDPLTGESVLLAVTLAFAGGRWVVVQARELWRNGR